MDEQTTLIIACKSQNGVAAVDDFTGAVGRADSRSMDLVKTLAALFAGNKFIGFAKSATNAFIVAEEAGFKFNVTFAKVIDDANRKAAELTGVYGLASKNAKSMLADTGDLLMGLGFSAAESLTLAERTAKLGIDLKSFNNYAGTAADATFALTKAMLGETEAAKALGVAIKTDSKEYQRRFKQMVAEKGMSEMQAKAYLALEMAYEQSGNAIGDYLRPGETLAQLQAQIGENTTATMEIIGRGLQGPARQLLEWTKAAGDGFRGLSDEQQDFITKTGAIFGVLAGIKTAMSIANTARALNNRLTGEGGALIPRDAAARSASAAAINQETAALNANNAARNMRPVAGASGTGIDAAAVSSSRRDLYLAQNRAASAGDALKQGRAAGLPPGQIAALERSYKTAQNGAKSAAAAYTQVGNSARAALREMKMEQINAGMGRFNVTMGAAQNTLNGVNNSMKMFPTLARAGATGMIAMGAGARMVGVGLKSATAAAWGLAKALLPMLAISGIIAGVDYLMNMRSKAADAQIGAADRQLNDDSKKNAKAAQIRDEQRATMEYAMELRDLGPLSGEAAIVAKELADANADLGISYDENSKKLLINADAMDKLSARQREEVTLEAKRQLLLTRQKREAQWGGLEANIGESSSLFSFGSRDRFREFLEQQKMLPGIEQKIAAATQRRNQLIAIGYDTDRLDSYIASMERERDLQKQIAAAARGEKPGQMQKPGAGTEAAKKRMRAALDESKQLKGMQKDLESDVEKQIYDLRYSASRSSGDQQKFLADELTRQKGLARTAAMDYSVATGKNRSRYTDEKRTEFARGYYDAQRKQIELLQQQYEIEKKMFEEREQETARLAETLLKFRSVSQDTIRADSVEGQRLQARRFLSTGGGLSNLSSNLAKQTADNTKKLIELQNDIKSTLVSIQNAMDKLKASTI